MKAVLFDLDGVLVDSEPLWREAIDALLRRHGAAYDERVAARHQGLRLPDVVKVLREAHGLGSPPDALGAELVRDLHALFARSLAPLPGAAEAIARARADGLGVAVASSSPRAVVADALGRCGWRLDAVLTGDDVARGKPAPDLFLRAAERLGVEPRECLVVEDSAHGVRAAKAAGMFCVSVPGPVPGADAFVASLLELPAYWLR